MSNAIYFILALLMVIVNGGHAEVPEIDCDVDIPLEGLPFEDCGKYLTSGVLLAIEIEINLTIVHPLSICTRCAERDNYQLPQGSL